MAENPQATSALGSGTRVKCRVVARYDDQQSEQCSQQSEQTRQAWSWAVPSSQPGRCSVILL